MSNHELDCAVAAALGWEIVPARKAHGGTFETGKTYIFTQDGVLWHGPSEDSGQWSPSTDAGDALAALEAWQKQSHGSWLLGGEGSQFYTCDLIRNGHHDIEAHGKSICEVACNAIVAAQEPSRG